MLISENQEIWRNFQMELKTYTQGIPYIIHAAKTNTINIMWLTLPTLKRVPIHCEHIQEVCVCEMSFVWLK